MQTQITVRHHLIPIRTATIKNKTTGIGEDTGRLEHLCTVCGSIKCYSLYGKQSGKIRFFKNGTTI